MEFNQVDLFQSLTNTELNEINKIARKMHFGRGETIFAEGAFERNIYIIETGQVEVFKRSPIHGDQTLAILKNGDYFGEMAFFEKTASRSASARTMQATNLVMIEGGDFERLLHSHPSISLKLLSTLSQRLRESNKTVVLANKTAAPKDDCKVLTVASAKDGYGKSTFASVLAKMMTSELNKRLLFIDLDLYFAGATQMLGLHSPKSIIDVNKKIQADENSFDLMNECVRVSENFFVVPAPRSFLEAEQVHSDDLTRVVRMARKSFDYVIIDTGSVFDENLFTALDTADFIFFLLNFSNLSTITDNVRFFQGIAKLSYPRERLILLANHINSEFSTTKTSKVFPYPIIGGLPRLVDSEPQFGKTPYDKNPNGPYCEMVRLLVRNILKETELKKPETKGTFLHMLFGDKDPDQAINLQLDQLHSFPGNSFMPVISSADVRSQVKYIRYNMMFGYLDEARDNLMAFLEYSHGSAPLLELLGELLLIQDNVSESLEAFQKAIAINADQHLSLGYLGCLTGNDKKTEEAIKIVVGKIEKNPTHLDLLNDYGKILLRAEKYEEALVQFQKALDANPQYISAKINMTDALANLNKADQAIEVLLGIGNKSPRIFFALGEIFYKTGRLYLAFKAYNKAAVLYPTYPRMHAKITELSNYMRKLDTLIDLHERFVNTNPNFPDLHAKLGNFYHLAGKSELAIEEFKKALEINPEYSYASMKLDTLHRDVIWRLAKTHLEEYIEEHQAVTKELVANLHCEGKKIKKGHFPDDAVIQIRNVRSSKEMQKAISLSQFEQGFARIDCAPLGLVACQDILLFQIIDVKSKKVLRFEPHYLELEEIKAGSCDVKLNMDPSAHEIEEEILAKYFLVHLDSKQFAEIISGEDTTYKAVVKNQTNGLIANGHINPENEEQINFVLNGASSGNGLAAVSPGDRLSIKIEDSDATEVFSMEFAIGNSDIKNFCKTIVPQDIS